MISLVCSITIESVSLIMGVSKRSVKRWIALFEKTGNVLQDLPRGRSSRCSERVYKHIRGFIDSNPCIYIEELQVDIMMKYPELTNVSIPTICRALRHDNFQEIRTLVHLETLFDSDN